MIIVAVMLLWACSATKHVPDGQFLLDNVKIEVSDSDKEVKTEELINFLRQQPNHKVLGFAKLRLGTYNLSGKDSTKWFNRWMRSLGTPPVIYDHDLTQASVRQLRQALINRGYLDAVVFADTVITHPKKIDVDYKLIPGKARFINSISYEFEDPEMQRQIMSTLTPDFLKTGEMFDRNMLDSKRGEVAASLRDKGYYGYSKESISFIADTVAGSDKIELIMHVGAPKETKDAAAVPGMPEAVLSPSGVYMVRDIDFYVDCEPGATNGYAPRDSVNFKGIRVFYGKDRYLRPGILDEKCLIRRGERYSEKEVEKTYESLSQLTILKFINIEMTPVATVDGVTWLDARIFLSRNRKQGITVSLEGTNSEGDLGFGVGASYVHRNIAKGSETLTAKLRASYESLSGNFNGLINDRYTEYAGEVGLTIPKFECPFLSKSFKQKILANTEFDLSFNYQERPEYTRFIGGAAWKYKWQTHTLDMQTSNTYDFLDINYVKLPKSTLNFIDEITNPLLRYSYEDHFIMRTGYTFYRTNRRIPTMAVNAFAMQPSITTFRFSAETAGNLLYAISKLSGQKEHEGAYKVFGTRYSQYVKGEFDYTFTRNFNDRNALAMRLGVGIAYPYGNSKMVPFEKRFYAGGANGVRGWGVRSLGPGCYDAKNELTDFIYQCGDISLIASLEYRAKIFWVFEGAVFVDAGNIWTIKDYATQPGGMFKFNKFYKQIAASYGVGIRMDFTYFLLRFDLGLKAHNPAMNQEPWPLVHPRWGRDANFHFSVGYPF